MEALGNNWRDPAYLLQGDAVQQLVYRAIQSSRILEILQGYDPLLVGTYPIGIYLPGSDIDIVCHACHNGDFESILQKSFGHLHDFSVTRKKIREEDCIIVRFSFSGFLFEIFGQDVPVEKQYAYRHMLVEHQLLSLKDHGFRKMIMEQKEKGLSTEEAFCKILGIPGDPYEGLMKFSIE